MQKLMLTHEQHLISKHEPFISKHEPLVDVDMTTSIHKHLNADSDPHTIRLSN